MSDIYGAQMRANFVQESFVSPTTEFEVDNLQDYLFPGSDRAQGGVLTRNPVNVVSRSLNGALARGFGDLWFNHIHIFPDHPVDVGNLTGNQTREIEIFNAYLEENVSLDAVTPSGNLSGVDFDLTPPETLAPLESKIFLLSINLSGAPEFSGNYSIQTSANGQILNLQVLGRRIIVFPFRINWEDGVSEEIAYLVKIYEASKGKEQRVLHNLGKARRAIEYDYIFAASNDLAESNNLRMLFDSLVYGWQHRNFIINESFDEMLLEADLYPGFDFVPQITAYRDFEIGSYLLLWRNEYDFEAGEVADILPNGIQLARPLEKFFPAIQTKCAPARVAFMDDKVSEQTLGGNRSITRASIKWQINPPMSQGNNRFMNYSLPVYRSFDVFQFPEGQETDRSRSIERKINTLDYRIGNIWREAEDRAPRSRFPVRMNLIGRQEIAQFLKFYDTKKGQLAPFWYNPQTMDFQLLQTTPPNADSLIVKRTGQAAFRANGLNARDLVIKLRAGGQIFRRITNALEAGDQETFSLDSVIPASINPNDVQSISLLRPVRFDNEKLSLKWITVDKAYTQFNLFDLENL